MAISRKVKEQQVIVLAEAIRKMERSLKENSDLSPYDGLCLRIMQAAIA